MAAGTGITCFVNGDKRDASLAAIQQGGGIGPDPLDVTTGKSCGINLTFWPGTCLHYWREWTNRVHRRRKNESKTDGVAGTWHGWRRAPPPISVQPTLGGTVSGKRGAVSGSRPVSRAISRSV